MSTPIPPAPFFGPHCHHDDCGHGPCDESGHVEFPCVNRGCPFCGAPAYTSAAHWGGDLARYLAMSPERQAEVRAYWERFPLVRQAYDVLPTIPAERRHAAAALLEAARAVNGGGR